MEKAKKYKEFMEAQHMNTEENEDFAGKKKRDKSVDYDDDSIDILDGS